MRKKLFTLMTLLLTAVMGAWATDYTLGASTFASSGDGEKKVSTVDGQTFSLDQAHGGSGQSGYSEYIKFSSNKTYTLTLPTGFSLTNINIKGYTNKDNDATGGIASIGGVAQTGKTFPARNDASLSTASQITDGYDFAITQTGGTVAITTIKAQQVCVLITITGTPAPVSAGAPVFSPVSGSSVAEGSKIEITSTNSTSIKYKWTSSDETPTSDWLTYDADAKVTVPASSVGTPYLHAQGYKDETPGDAGYALYTITAPDTEAPVFDSATPANGATNVAVDAALTATYNENIVIDNSKIALVKTSDESEVDFTATASGAVLTVTPDAVLDYNTGYTLTIGAGAVADGSGNATAAATVIAFTTVKETVATPVVTPKTGKKFAESVALNATCATDGATVYYSLDDGDTWTALGTGIFVTETATVKVKATKADYNDSEIVTVTYTKVTGLVAQTNVTGPATWDWSEITSGECLLTESDVMNEDVVMANLSRYGYTVTAPATFDQQALLINCQYAYRNANDSEFLQGSMIEFNVTLPGTVTIEYANTGNNAARTVKVNTTKGSKSSTANNSYQSEEFEVAAGTVTISGVQVSDDAGKMLRIRKIVFAPFVAITPSNTKTTYVTTQALDFTDVEGLKAYVATTSDASSVTLESVTAVPAGTPLVLKGTKDTEYKVPVVASASAPATNFLKAGPATINAGDAEHTRYVLSGGVFKKIVTDGVVIPAGKAYLEIDESSLAPELSLNFNDENNDVVTGINSVDAQKHFLDGEFYNLAGQRVSVPSKGLYIVNGKKVIVK